MVEIVAKREAGERARKDTQFAVKAVGKRKRSKRRGEIINSLVEIMSKSEGGKRGWKVRDRFVESFAKNDRNERRREVINYQN